MRLHESWGREWFLVGRERTQNVKTSWAIFFSHLDSNTPILWRESSVIYSWSIEYAYVETDQRLIWRECVHSRKLGSGVILGGRQKTHAARRAHSLTRVTFHFSSNLLTTEPTTQHPPRHYKSSFPRIHVPIWAPAAGNTIFFSNCAPHLSGFCHSSHIYQFLPRSPNVVPLDWKIMASFQLYTRRAVHLFWKLQDSSLVVLGCRVQVITRTPRLYTRFFIRFQSVDEVYDVWRH